jgi:hypothetical protein
VCLASDNVANDNARSALKQEKSGKNARHANRRLAGRREKGGKSKTVSRKLGKRKHAVCVCVSVWRRNRPGYLPKQQANDNAVHRRLGEALASVVTLRAAASATAMQVMRIEFASLARLPWCLSDVPWPPMSCHVAEQERTARKRRLWCEMGLCKHPDGVEHNATAVVQRQGK